MVEADAEGLRLVVVVAAQVLPSPLGEVMLARKQARRELLPQT